MLSYLVEFFWTAVWVGSMMFLGFVIIESIAAMYEKELSFKQYFVSYCVFMVFIYVTVFLFQAGW